MSIVTEEEREKAQLRIYNFARAIRLYYLCKITQEEYDNIQRIVSSMDPGDQEVAGALMDQFDNSREQIYRR